VKFLGLLLIGVTLSFGAVDINKADKAELMSIKGIGESKATAIIEHRTNTGCFADIEALKAVKGIGEKFIEKNKENIVASACEKK